VRILANPVLLRAIIVLVCAGSAFLLGLLSVRLLRSKLQEDEMSPERPRNSQTFPLDVYNTVIQQLKQQKHELHVQSQAEQQRARTNENFSQAVLANLSCGVLVFDANGLVKNFNPAVKTILGFASLAGMSAEDLFRGATVRSTVNEMSSDPVSVAEEMHAVLHERSKRRQLEAEYEAPNQQKHFLAITLSPVPATDGSLMGVACLITDLSELESLRKQQELRSETSAEMALRLRTSLNTISGYAQQLAGRRDAALAEQLAKDIVSEAAQLDRSIEGFLTARPADKAVAAAGSGA
jgi:PAS domain-containing protein